MDLWEELREAGDVGTSPERLEELSEHGEREVRRAVAGNANTPWRVLESLAWEFPREFLENPVGMVQMIVKPEEICVEKKFWEVVLREEEVPEVWVRWLKGHKVLREYECVKMHVGVSGEIVDGEQGCEDVRVRRMLARYKRTPQEVLRRLVYDEDRLVREFTVNNKMLPEEMLAVLAKDDVPYVRALVAKSGRTSTEVLACLGDDVDRYVRTKVACNGKTLVEVLRILADDEWEVRAGVASNMGMPEDVVEKLLRDRDLRVRKGVHETQARDEKTPEEMLRKLADHSQASVREMVAGNKKTPLEALELLATDPVLCVCRTVPRNEGLSEEMLCVFARQRDPLWRKIVLLNPMVPVVELQRLEDDKDEEVRRRARNMMFLRSCAPVNKVYPGYSELDKKISLVNRYVYWVDHLECSQEVREALLGLLLKSHQMKRGTYMLRRPYASEQVLREGGDDRNWQKRWWVAVHPGTPEEVRERLKRDGNRAVRWAARGVFG